MKGGIMKGGVVLKSLAVLAVLFGVTAIVDGLPIVLGIKNPDHLVLPWLIYYNLTMAAVSIFVGFGFWLRHAHAINVAGLVAVGHTIVWLLILTIFSDAVAMKSVIGMTVRSVIWISMFVLLSKKKESWFAPA